MTQIKETDIFGIFAFYIICVVVLIETKNLFLSDSIQIALLFFFILTKAEASNKHNFLHLSYFQIYALGYCKSKVLAFSIRAVGI